MFLLILTSWGSKLVMLENMQEKLGNMLVMLENKRGMLESKLVR